MTTWLIVIAAMLARTRAVAIRLRMKSLQSFRGSAWGGTERPTGI